MTTLLFVRCIRPLSSVVKKKVSPLAHDFTKSTFLIGSAFKKKQQTTKKEKKRARTPKETADKIFFISERERENEKTKTKKRTKDEFDEIRPTNAFVGRKRSEVTLVRENSGLGRRGDERGSGEESHLGWNLATDDVRFAETDGGRERLGE